MKMEADDPVATAREVADREGVEISSPRIHEGALVTELTAENQIIRLDVETDEFAASLKELFRYYTADE